jgi:hypothetical protein
MRSLGKARKVSAGLSAFKKIIVRKKTSPHNLVSEKEINHQTIYFFLNNQRNFILNNNPFKF